MLERAVTVGRHEGGQDGRKRRDLLRHPVQDPGTKSLMAGARQGAVGVIYPVLL